MSPVTSYGYDENRNEISQTDANSHVVTMVYDDGAKAIGEWGNGKIVGKAPVPPLTFHGFRRARGLSSAL